MFESLSTRIQDVFRSLQGEVRLTEDNIEAALRRVFADLGDNETAPQP